jgi:hypothetical protein
MWDTITVRSRVLFFENISTERIKLLSLDGCPTFAPAYVGLRSRAEPLIVFGMVVLMSLPRRAIRMKLANPTNLDGEIARARSGRT